MYVETCVTTKMVHGCKACSTTCLEFKKKKGKSSGQQDEILTRSMRCFTQAVDLKSMCDLMNSNDYKNDPLSQGSPCNQISARCDLPDAAFDEAGHQHTPPPSNGPFPFGGIDSKNVDRLHVQQQLVRTISGMPYDHVPIFTFQGQWDSVPHQGMPETFKFNWTTMAPEL
eukprot:m.169995 g.169995  ORF g.169995 m.169995 type:complete len:170 (+) comp16483_c1_seq5:48-557(+)